MTLSIPTLLVLIPAMPLVATLVTALLGRHVLGERSHYPVVIGLVIAAVLSLRLVSLVWHESETPTGVGWETTVTLWNWAQVDNALPSQLATSPAAATSTDAASTLPASLPFSIDVTLRADGLTAIMLAMVTFVSTLVAIYAKGYMHGDRGYWRFYTYIGLFVFSMTMLVSVSNFVLLYVFWEAVGLCSYLLVGFWYEKPAAIAAGKKAFLVNRVGDFGFALGLFLIWTTYGTLNFHDTADVAGVLGQTRLSHPQLYVGGMTATAICLLLLLGACGKSAQFPLHVWLPDAMEGPTPVSALIHAATMVTAGVYMVARCTPLFFASPEAQSAVAIVGTTTVALGGYIALTQTDLKRVLAYSTISQLGYMFLGLGIGTLSGITSGMFHLFTHAFFKALLFLAAGSVMHAMGGVIDMRRFGGLRKLMPATHWTFLFGALALAGVFPFAGFWSKDAILANAYERGMHDTLFHILYWIAMVTAGLTAFYTFRAFFLTFYGPERVPYEAGEHAHESPRVMTFPLVILAFFSLVIGAYFARNGQFAELLGRTPSLAYPALVEHSAPAIAAHRAEHGTSPHTLVAITSTLGALLGIGLAAFFYLGGGEQISIVTRAVGPLYWLSLDKLFIDPIYQAVFVWPLWLLAEVCYWLDRHLVDAVVNFVGAIPRAVAAPLRALQSGMVQFYALAMVWGILVLATTLLLWPSLTAIWK